VTLMVNKYIAALLLIPSVAFSATINWGGTPDDLNVRTNNNLNLIAMHRLNTEALLVDNVCKVVTINEVSYFMCDQKQLKKIICYSGDKPCQP
jgi:hypothetical protein